MNRKYFILLLIPTVFRPNNCEDTSTSSSNNVVNVQSKTPAASFRLYRDGMDTIAQAVGLVAPQLALDAKLPDYNLTISSVDIRLKNAAIKNFTKPIITYTLAAPNRVTIDFATGPIDVAADWLADRSTFFGWNQQHDAGQLRLHMDSFRTSFVGEFGSAHPNGLPSLVLPSCSTQMGKAKITIANASQKFFTDIIQTFSIVIRTLVQSQMCSIAKGIVASEVNKRIAAVPDVLGCATYGVGVKYYLDPLVTSEFVELTVKAQLVEMQRPTTSTTMMMPTTVQQQTTSAPAAPPQATQVQQTTQSAQPQTTQPPLLQPTTTTPNAAGITSNLEINSGLIPIDGVQIVHHEDQLATTTIEIPFAK